MTKYEEVYEQIKERILDKTFPPKSYLPSEESLAISYQVSRETLRKSLQMLASEGYIQKVAKKGNMVLPADQFTLSATLLSNFKEFTQSQGESFDTETRVYKFEAEAASPSFLKAELMRPSGTPMYAISRQRILNGESVIIDKDFIVKSVIPGLTKEIAAQSIYDYIEKDLALSIGYAKREIKVEPVTTEDQQFLDLSAADTHLVVVRSRAYLADSRFFQFTESRHRIDKFKILEFAKRRNSW